MVAGMHKYLDRDTAERRCERAPQCGSTTSPRPTRFGRASCRTGSGCKKFLGVVDERVKPTRAQYVAAGDTGARSAKLADARCHAVRWAVLPGVDADGLLHRAEEPRTACAVVVPHADETPSKSSDSSPAMPFAVQLTASPTSCRVLRADADRPPRRPVGNQKLEPADEPAAPRVRPPHGLRDGPHPDRVRGPEDARRRSTGSNRRTPNFRSA